MPLRVTAHADVPHPVPLQDAGLDHGEGVVERPERLRRVPRDHQHVLAGALGRQRSQVLLEHVLRPQPPAGDVRHRHEPEPPDRPHGVQPHPQVLVLQEGDVDPRARRNGVTRRLELAGILPGHFQGKVLKQSFHAPPFPILETLLCRYVTA